MPEPVGKSSQRYMPGLDGLRAIAVLAVIAYHLEIGFAKGGLLGVGIFFTLSGYLITDILMEGWVTRRLKLSQFWLARARRLLPASRRAIVANCGSIVSAHGGRNRKNCLLATEGSSGTASLAFPRGDPRHADPFASNISRLRCGSGGKPVGVGNLHRRPHFCSTGGTASNFIKSPRPYAPRPSHTPLGGF